MFLLKASEIRPPAISTLPLDSNVAVAPVRPIFITGVEVGGANLLLLVSYSSVLARGYGWLLIPPANSTLPLDNSVAVAFSRSSFMNGVMAANMLTDGGPLLTRPLSILT